LSGFFPRLKVVAVAEGNSIQNDPLLVEWAGRILLDQIPGLLIFLTARLLTETNLKPNADHDKGTERAQERLLNASELAQHLHLPSPGCVPRNDSVDCRRQARQVRPIQIDRSRAHARSTQPPQALDAPFSCPSQRLDAGCDITLVVSSRRRWQASRNST